MKPQLAPPGVDPIEYFGDAPAPKAALAGCFGPAVMVLAVVALALWGLPRLNAAQEPPPLPTVEALPTITQTPTPSPTGTIPPTPTIRPSSTLPPTYTPTWTPSPTQLPTWTPTGTRLPWVLGSVANAPELNVRAGPGLGYPVLGVIRRGDPVSVVAREPGGMWGKITSPVAGWVHLSYILPDAGHADNLVWLPIVTDPPLVN